MKLNLWVSEFESRDTESLPATLHCQVQTRFFYIWNKNKSEKTIGFKGKA